MKKIIAILLCLFINISMIVTASAKSTIDDYYIKFDVWQGSGNANVVIKDTNGNSSLNEQLRFENFEYLFYNNSKIDANFYTIDNIDGMINLTLKEDFLNTLSDGHYYFDAAYTEITIRLLLYVAKNKVELENLILATKEWNGSSITFSLSDINYPLTRELFNQITIDNKILDSDCFNLRFLGHLCYITFYADYLKTLPLGTYQFTVDFENVQGITLNVEIPDCQLKGDVNGDNEIDAADARLALRVAAKLEKLTTKAEIACDVNEDNTVNSIDARLILRVAAKLERF